MSADLALAADPSIVERAADPGEFIIQACERAKAWLREALDHGDIDSIVECKSQAEAIRVYTMSKQLGKDAQLSATEIVRRAERGIGVAIRKGIQGGTIQGAHGGNRRGADFKFDQGELEKPRPTDFATKGELYGGGNGGRAGIYDITDGVSDENFEEAVAAAKAQGDLSRANLSRNISRPARTTADWLPEPGDNHGDAPIQRRKLIRAWAEEGYSSRQIAERLKMPVTSIRQIARDCDIDIPADKIIGKTRLHDSNRIVRETVHALEGLVMGVELIDPDDLDVSEAANWAASLTDSIRVLNRLIKTLKGTAQ